MVKQLPTITAPRDFTLPIAPTRWLIFPTTPVFSALSAAAATFLVAIGALLLFSMTMSASTPQPAADQQEVALQSNTVSATDSTAGNGAQDVQASATLVALPSTSTGDIQQTATMLAFTFAPTMEINLFSTTAQPEEMDESALPVQDGASTTLTIAEVENAAEATQEDAADIFAISVQPQSTGTPRATGTAFPSTFAAPQGTLAPEMADGAAGTTAGDDEASTRFFEPSEPPAANTDDQQQAETGLAQLPSATALATQTPSATPTPTATPAVTATPPATLAPTFTAVPSLERTAASRGIPAILGAGLVLLGAVLFGIAFMTAVTRRSENRKRKG
jgi:hypothetical protein